MSFLSNPHLSNRPTKMVNADQSPKPDDKKPEEKKPEEQQPKKAADSA